MARKLTKFLIELSQDPLKRQQFENNPETVMRAAGLSAADKELVLARDASQIRAHFGVKTLAHMTCQGPNDPPDLKEIQRCIINHERRLSTIEKRLKPTGSPAKKKKTVKKKGPK